MKSSFEEYDVFEPKKKKICTICQTENDILASYCIRCNTDLRDIVCPVCKTLNPFNQKYCKNCESILQNRKRY